MTGRRGWIGLSFALSTMGCGTPPHEHFYTLSDYPLGDYTPGELASGDAAAAGSNYSVAIAPVSVPEGVDRPQMVVRAGTNRVELSELHRWAEPLKSEIPRVLAVHLRRALATADQGPLERYRDFECVRLKLTAAARREPFPATP
ncbi:MAG: PqiC family protein [Pseudomonadota bacterium]